MAKRKKAQEWEPLPIESYQHALTAGVQFSAKAVSTNAPPGGVRLAPGQARCLPYVCVQSLLARGGQLPLDSLVGGIPLKVFKQIGMALGWNSGEISNQVPAQDATAIQRYIIEAMGKGTTPGLDAEKSISPRLRQLIFPDGAGGYLTLIPLASPVFAARASDRYFAVRERLVEEEKEGLGPKPAWLRRAFLGYGGSNPQNAGLFLRRMQVPFFFEGPQEDRQLRWALAIHYAGTSLQLPRQIMNAYRKWRLAASENPEFVRNLAARKKEYAFISDVVRSLHQRGASDLRLLRSHADNLPAPGVDGSLVSPQVDLVRRGLTDPAARPRDWQSRFARQVADNIRNFSFGDGVLGLSAGEVRAIESHIKREVTGRV